MAENKNTQGTTPDTQGTTPEKSTKNTKEKLVPVFIHKQSRSDTERFVAVNGERILVKTGETVEIPERFAEVLKNSEKMSVVANEYIEANMTLLDKSK